MPGSAGTTLGATGRSGVPPFGMTGRERALALMPLGAASDAAERHRSAAGQRINPLVSNETGSP